jgi:hypothetical protein
MNGRLDSDFYEPSRYSKELAVVRSRIPNAPLSSFAEPGTSVTYGIVQPGTFVAPGHGVRMIRCVDISGLSVKSSEVLWVSHEIARPYSRSSVLPRDVLIGIAGSLGCIAVVPREIEPANLNQSVARLRANIGDGEDPEWIAAFLASSYGQAILLRRSVGSVQQHLNLGDLPEIPVVNPASTVRKYVGEKVRQAERLRAKAQNLLTSATRLVDLLIDGEMTEDQIKAHDFDHGRLASPQQQDHCRRAKHARTRHVELTNRIDAWYYQPHLVSAYQKIKASGNCQILADVIDNDRDVKGGATPLGAEYIAGGTVRFYRTSEVSGLAVHSAHAVFISEEQDRAMTRSRLAEGDVLLTITGADFGHAGVITKRHLPGNISQHSVRFRPTIDPSYLVAYLESSYGQRMIWRQAYGATRPAIDYPGVKSLLIRVPDPAVQTVIGDAVRSGVLARDCASWLVSGAKLLVEALIEGKVTEDELVNAQKALERGDRAIDHAILSRLTEDGIDVADKPPLFADLDALYAIIDEAQRTQPSSGDTA